MYREEAFLTHMELQSITPALLGVDPPQASASLSAKGHFSQNLECQSFGGP